MRIVRNMRKIEEYVGKWVIYEVKCGTREKVRNMIIQYMRKGRNMRKGQNMRIVRNMRKCRNSGKCRI